MRKEKKSMAIIICLVLAVIWAALGVRSLMEKGLLLNNAYLYASQKERETMDKKPHYHQSGMVFLFIAGIFLLLAANSAWHQNWMLWAEGVLVVGTIAYAIGSSIHIARNTQKE